MVRAQLAPSLLSADFAHLADEVARVAPASDWMHVDVMDAHFVPNLTLGLPVVQSLRAATDARLDCHLMIDDPDTWAPRYAAAADSVTVHAEAVRDARATAAAVHDAGARAGIAVDRQTPVEDVLAVLPSYDLLLVMTIQAPARAAGEGADRASAPRRARPGAVAAGRRRGQRRHHRAVRRGRCRRLRRRQRGLRRRRPRRRAQIAAAAGGVGEPAAPAVRAARLPRALTSEVLDRIGALDPVADCEEVYRLHATLAFPFEVQRALELTLFRTYAVASIGALLDATQEFAQRTQKRYDDTVLLLSEAVEQGLDSDRGREAVRRVNRIHARFDIGDDDMRYVLATFVVVPLRWLDRHGWRPVTDAERVATHEYYRRLGTRMGIRGVPATWQEFAGLMDAYEAEHFARTPAVAAVGTATRELSRLAAARARAPRADPRARAAGPAAAARLRLPRRPRVGRAHERRRPPAAGPGAAAGARAAGGPPGRVPADGPDLPFRLHAVRPRPRRHPAPRRHRAPGPRRHGPRAATPRVSATLGAAASTRVLRGRCDS